MATHNLAGRLYYVRYGVVESWYDVYERPDPGSNTRLRLAPGQAFDNLEDRVQGPLHWYHVRGTHMDLLGGGPSSFRPFDGYLKEPADGSINALATVPVKEYEGVPSLLAVDDLIALVDNHPNGTESVYQMAPNAENEPPTAGVVGPRDLARIDSGPFRTANNVLYWHVEQVNGNGRGWVREAARAGTHYEAKIRPYRLAQNR